LIISHTHFINMTESDTTSLRSVRSEQHEDAFAQETQPFLPTETFETLAIDEEDTRASTGAILCLLLQHVSR
jgi:hypothetical protein